MDSWGTIIAAASTSPLGILALLILVVSLLATQLLKDASPRVRVSIFLMIFAAVVGYGFTVINTGGSKSTTSVVPDLAATTASDAKAGGDAPAPRAEATSGPVSPGGLIAAGGVAAGARSDCALIPDSSVRRLDPAELSGLSDGELKVARNEIYARHGYIFKTTDMRAHFAACGYTANVAQVNLSALELANVAVIRRAETER